jgi:hypothetical protein
LTSVMGHGLGEQAPPAWRASKRCVPREHQSDGSDSKSQAGIRAFHVRSLPMRFKAATFMFKAAK